MECNSNSKTGTLVIIQPTSLCNLNCKYCYLPFRTENKVLSLELLEKIFDGALKSPITFDPITFAYHAGEPLLLPKEFYRKSSDLLKEKNEKYNRHSGQGLQTNATLIDEEWAEIFKENRFKIGVSIDGPEFIHDRNRVNRNEQGSHKKVMDGVRVLQDKGVDFTVIGVLTDFSLDYPDEIYDFFVSNEITHVGFNIDEFGATDYISTYSKKDFPAIEEKYKNFMRRFLYLVDHDKGKLTVREFNKIASIIAKSAVAESNIIKGVTIPFNIITFDVEGNYSTFCPELISATSPKWGRFTVGNIINQELDKASSTEKFQAINDEIQAGVTACKNSCPYWVFCGGGTPSSKFYETGRFDITETMDCRIHIKALSNTVIEYLQAKVS